MDFLSLSDQKAFRAKLKDSRKFPKPKNIAYVLNRDGFVNIIIPRRVRIALLDMGGEIIKQFCYYFCRYAWTTRDWRVKLLMSH